MANVSDIHPLFFAGLLIAALALMAWLTIRSYRAHTGRQRLFRAATFFAAALGILFIALGTLDHVLNPRTDPDPGSQESPLTEARPDRSPARDDSCRVTIHVPPMMNNSRVLINDTPIPVLERLHSAIIVRAALSTYKQKIIVVGEYRQCITFITISGDMDVEPCL